MAITVVFEFPDEPVERYDQALEMAEDLKVQPTRSHHICYRTATGFTVVDVWQSEADFAAFAELLGPVLAELGLHAEPRIYPLHNTM
ncbi:MAG: hypothetical protein ACRD0C_19835 [Acidimicrobiia bacterium]